MKKTYVTPVSKEYQVHVQNMLAESLGFGTGEATEGDVKEEKSSGSGIWDLYN